MSYVLLVMAAAAVSGMLWYGYFYGKEKELLNQLQKMIEQAQNGTLRRTEISETKRSALENSLKRYLDDSTLAGARQARQNSVVQSLISDISHQTLTPISNLKIYTELLQEQTQGDRELIHTIYEQTEKLDFLIQSLLKLSRMEHGIISVNPRQTAFLELFYLLKSQFQQRAADKNIHLKICETDLTAQFDLKWTNEAIGNIVDNAIKYTRSGGSVKITVTAYPLFVRIDVLDTGIGIAEEEIPQIFTRFFRSIDVSEQPGVGIGLYLSRMIIQAQKGYIKVISEAGHGSTFSVFLPR